jgi:hypothetical protein
MSNLFPFPLSLSIPLPWNYVEFTTFVFGMLGRIVLVPEERTHESSMEPSECS